MQFPEATKGVIDVSEVATVYEDRLRERVWALADRTDTPASLAIITEEPYDPSSFEQNHVGLYVRGLCEAASRVGVNTRVEGGLEYAGLRNHILEHRYSPATDGMVVTLPLRSVSEGRRPAFTERLIAGIPREKDVDGLRRYGMPATAEAADMVLRSVTEDTNRTALVRGGGGHVGRALVRLLGSRGYDVLSFDKDTPAKDQRAMLCDADIIFSATGHAEGLTPTDFKGLSSEEVKVLINIGRGSITVGTGDGAVTKTVGDFSPKLIQWARERGWKVSGGAFGVGRLATLVVMGRTITAAEKRTAR